MDSESFYVARLEITTKDKSSIRKMLDKIESKLSSLMSQVSRKPRETELEITKTIADLESRLLSSKDDKAVISALEKAKLKRKSILDHNQVLAEIDQLKQQREALRSSLFEKDSQIENLLINIRKTSLAKHLNANPDQFIIGKVTLPEEKVDLIVGKDGAALKLKEAEFGVSIELDSRDDNVLNILGLPSNVAAAMEAINKSKQTAEEEVQISEETMICISRDQNQLIDIQNKYTVRLELSRLKGTCRISGARDAIEATKKMLQSIDSLRQIVRIDPSSFRSIVPRSCLTLSTMEETHQVKIDIVSRDNCELAITGIRDNVLNVVDLLKSFNEECEEVIHSDKHKLNGLFMINQGEPKKKFSRDYNVTMFIEKATSGSSKSGTLYIKGLKFKVAIAKEKILQMLEEFDKNSVTLTIPEDVMPLLIGKSGMKINSLRDTFLDGGIDVDKTTVRISGSDAAKRQDMVNTIMDFVNNNYIKIIKLTEENAHFIRGPKYLDLKQQLSTLPKLSFDTDFDKREMRIRGIKSSVDEAVGLIELAWDGIYSEVVSLDEEDCASLMNNAAPIPSTGADSASAGGGGAEPAASSQLSAQDALIFNPIRFLEDKFGIVFTMMRKECKVSIGGKKSQVLLAKQYMHGILEGDINCNSFVIAVEPIMYATLIGKGGANLRKFESECLVKLDVLKSKDLLRLRGSVKNILVAKEKVLEFLDEAKISPQMDVSKFTGKRSELETVLLKAERIFDIVIVDDKTGVIVLKGTRKGILDAKLYIEEFISQSAYFKILLTQIQISELDHTRVGYWDFHSLMSKHPNVNVVLNLLENFMEVRGAPADILAAKKAVYSFVAGLSPSEMAVFNLSIRCIKFTLTPKQLRLFTSQYGEDLQILVDRSAMIVIVSGQKATVDSVSCKIKELVSAYEQQYRDIPISDSMMAALSARGLLATTLLALKMKVTMHVNRESNFIELHSSSPENLAQAHKVLEEELEKLDMSVDISIDESLVGSVIGKNGVQIKKLRSEVKAVIDFNKETRTLTLSGASDDVKAAEIHINNFLDQERNREKANFEKFIWVPAAAVPMLIGAGGRMCREIQSKSNTRIDFNKFEERAAIRGTEDACSLAESIILEKLREHGFEESYYAGDQEDSNSKGDEKEEESLPTEQDRTIEAATAAHNAIISKLNIPPGASDQMVKEMTRNMEEMNLSKSALKRKRKKEKEAKEAAEALEREKEMEREASLLLAAASMSSVPIQASQETDKTSNTTETVSSNLGSLSSLYDDHSKSQSSLLPGNEPISPSHNIEPMPLNKGFDSNFNTSAPSSESHAIDSLAMGSSILNMLNLSGSASSVSSSPTLLTHPILASLGVENSVNNSDNKKDSLMSASSTSTSTSVMSDKTLSLSSPPPIPLPTSSSSSSSSLSTSTTAATAQSSLYTQQQNTAIPVTSTTTSNAIPNSVNNILPTQSTSHFTSSASKAPNSPQQTRVNPYSSSSGFDPSAPMYRVVNQVGVQQSQSNYPFFFDNRVGYQHYGTQNSYNFYPSNPSGIGAQPIQLATGSPAIYSNPLQSNNLPTYPTNPPSTGQPVTMLRPPPGLPPGLTQRASPQTYQHVHYAPVYSMTDNSGVSASGNSSLGTNNLQMPMQSMPMQFAMQIPTNYTYFSTPQHMSQPSHGSFNNQIPSSNPNQHQSSFGKPLSSAAPTYYSNNSSSNGKSGNDSSPSKWASKHSSA